MNQIETTKESERLIFSPWNTSPTLARREREREIVRGRERRVQEKVTEREK